MNTYRRTWLLVCLVLSGVGIMLVGGAARSVAEPISDCSTGKPICASLTSNADPTSRSPVGNDHYMAYSVEVSYNTASGATWVSVHHGGGVGIGYSLHAGQVIVADGTDAAARRLERVLTNDPATGVLRHVDAGYGEAVDAARRGNLEIPIKA